MADKTNIEWTDATWNPITGCSVASPGCAHCYAMKLAGTRLKHHPSRAGLTVDTKAGPVWNGKVRFNEQWLEQPLRWKKPRMIFVCAHGDLFAEGVPDEWIDQVFNVMARAHWHTYQVLTKRAERMRDYMDQFRVLGHSVHKDGLRGRDFRDGDRFLLLQRGQQWPLANVWMGVSAEDQTRADERIPLLLQTDAAVRWVSAEPLLGPIDLERSWKIESGVLRETMPAIDWIVAGGESGDGARPMHPQWARDLRDQCQRAGVAFFFKQWGNFRPLTAAEHGQACGATLIGNDPHARDAYVLQVGKKAAGRSLDGLEHNAMPGRAA